MSIVVEIVQEPTVELVASLNALLPQLSTSAPPLSVAGVLEMVKSPAITLLVALSEGRVVGMLTLAIFTIPTGVRAWIEDVVVDEAARGQGVGEALTSEAILRAEARGARSIDLTSRPSREAANSLYLKLGFARRETNVYRFFIES